MKQCYKLILSYDGTNYCGWQKQSNTGNTVQAKLETVLEQLYRQKIEVNGSGRTDAGVHARGQVCSFHLDSEDSTDVILNKLRNALPQDISAISLEPADDRFHARLSAKGKRYSYHICCGPVPDLFSRKYEWFVPEPLDLKRMQEAIPLFLGTHDFQGFCSGGKSKKSTVRTIHSIDLQLSGSKLTLVFTGDGFLYNMVRLITGTLVMVGKGELMLEDTEQLFSCERRSSRIKMAPAAGLFLEEVFY